MLVEDAGVSYAELGARAGLSAPAAHERVKRMRRSGAIRRTAALLDADRVGKPLLAFVLVDTRGWGKTPELLAIASYPEVEEIHSVAGDACMCSRSAPRTRVLWKGCWRASTTCRGVGSTSSYVVLSTYLERPVQPAITDVWPAPKPRPAEMPRGRCYDAG